MVGFLCSEIASGFSIGAGKVLAKPGEGSRV